MPKPLRALTLRWTGTGVVCHEALLRIMKDIPFEFCASLSPKHNPYPNLNDESQPWFNTSDARNGIYPGDQASLMPLDEALIESMRDCEALFMYMMMRGEYARNIPYPERKHRYLKHLRFWNDFIERNRITILLSSTLPHEMPDHLIYALCKVKGIRTVFTHATPIRDTAFLQENIEESAVQIRDAYEALRGTDASGLSLSPKLEEYFAKQTSPKGTAAMVFPEKPISVLIRFHRRILSTKGAFMHWITSLWSAVAWSHRIHKFLSLRTQRLLRQYYDQHAVKPDLQKPYIYFPLQYQPECSTCPMAGAFVDQDISIHVLSKTAPNDVLIYVKEHPRQRKVGTLGRTLQFYRDLVAMPNVRLVAHETDTFDLREHCAAVATGTGTAGLEAIFRGKPVILFGHVFYQYGPAVFQVKTHSDCEHAMKEIFHNTVKPSSMEARRFLKAVENTRVHGSVTDLYYLNESDLTIEQSTGAFEAMLRKHLSALPA